MYPAKVLLMSFVCITCYRLAQSGFEPSPGHTMTINNQDIAELSDKLYRDGDTIDVSCSLASEGLVGSGVTLDCPGPSTNTTIGTQTSMTLQLNITFHEQSCTCSQYDGTATTNKLTEYVIHIMLEAGIKNFSINSKLDQMIEVAEGERISLECNAEGMPLPDMYIEKGQTYQKLTGGDVSMTGHLDKRLTVSKEFECQDSDTYSCMVANGIGDLIRQEVSIHVKCGARVLEGTDITIVIPEGGGMTQRLVATISIYPDPTGYRLYKLLNHQSKRKRATSNSRVLVDTKDYDIQFARLNLGSGQIEMDWVDFDDADTLYYSLAVLNGIDDKGSEIPFNFTRSTLTSTRSSSTSASFEPVLMLVFPSVIGGLVLCFMLIAAYMVWKREMESKAAKKRRKVERQRRETRREARGVHSPARRAMWYTMESAH